MCANDTISSPLVQLLFNFYFLVVSFVLAPVLLITCKLIV
jgi:hypothetical protein